MVDPLWWWVVGRIYPLGETIERRLSLYYKGPRPDHSVPCDVRTFTMFRIMRKKAWMRRIFQLPCAGGFVVYMIQDFVDGEVL